MLQDSARLTRSERSAKTSRGSIGFRRWNWAVLAIVLALVAVSKGPDLTVLAQSSCGQSINPIVCENQKTGRPQLAVGHQRCRRPPIQGFATDISVARTGRALQDRHERDAATRSTSTAWAITAGWAPGRSRRSRRRRRCRRRNQRVSTQPIDRSDRLRQLGRLGLVDRARGLRSPASTSPSCPRTRHRRREPHLLRRARRRRQLGPGVPDLGHDLAGLQPVRRQQPVCRRPGHQPGARLQGELQPAVHHARSTSRRTSSSTPNTRWSAGSRRTATTSATSAASTPTARRDDPAQAQGFLSVGHDEYWSGGSARTSRRRATPASTSRSSAATRCSGRRAGRTASTARTRRTGRSSLQGDARQREASIPTIRRRGPAPGATRASARRADGGRPENALTGTIFMVNAGDQRRSRFRPRSASALLAQHQRRHPRRRQRRDAADTARSATSGTRTSTTVRGRPGLIRPVARRPSSGVDAAPGLTDRRTGPAPSRTA